MRNSNLIMGGSLPLNNVYSNYPNCYFTLHQGVGGTDPGDIADQAGTSLVASPLTTTTEQWTTKPGYWSGTATNAADAIIIDRLNDAVSFDKIFTVDNSVLVLMGYVFADTDPSAVGRLWELGNLTPSAEVLLGVKTPTSGVLQGFQNGTSANAAQNGIDLPAEPAPNENVIIQVIDNTSTQLATMYTFNPATKVLSKAAAASDLSTVILNTTIPSNQSLSIGSNHTATAYGSFARNISIRDFRAVNFGPNPPADLSEIIEEMAINSCMATRR